MSKGKGIKAIASLIVALCVAVGGWLIGNKEKIEPMENGRVRVHFIDVGQGDSILVQLPKDKYMLVDAGEREEGKAVIEYLDNMGVDKVDFIVGTHPHSDHIGGLQSVIENFETDKIYMPKVAHDSATFENLVKCIKNKGKKVHAPNAGEILYSEDGVEIKCLSPVKAEYENLNDYSIVLKVTYKNKSFLLTGDAENTALEEITESMDSDVLKVPHHGSETSVTDTFYEKVTPEYAVISVGKDNRYGHPHRESREMLESKNITYFRTDKSGTVVFETDGEYLKKITGGEAE